MLTRRISAVKTYLQNGNENGGGIADLYDSGTIDPLVKEEITTSDYIRLPLCSETLAGRSWDSADKSKSVRD